MCWAFSCLLIALGLVSRAKKRALRGDFILSIYFHNPSKKEFERCVKWLMKNKFKFLNDTDLDEIANQKVSFPKGAVFLSVDDGWQSNEENIVEVAKKYNIPVTIFVSTEPVEKGVYWWSYISGAKVQHLKEIPNEERLLLVNERKKEVSVDREAFSVDQLKRVAEVKQITIGGHTHTHPILPNCSDETVYKELRVSKEKLEKWINKEVTTFAYPNGDYGIREKEILEQLNYKYGFSNKPQYLTKDHFKTLMISQGLDFLKVPHLLKICVGWWGYGRPSCKEAPPGRK